MLQRDVITAAMRRALALARFGPAGDANPQVGCVILGPDGHAVAEGWHRGAGTPHAEVDALTRVPEFWRGRATELTAVVTLEPCNHTGRTGPCALALMRFGIGAVVYALSDPGDASAGGAATLRAAGVQVSGGELAGEARALLAPWLSRFAGGDGDAVGAGVDVERAHVTVKWAQTLDGRAAAADGSSQWITGAAARADVHLRRAQADAILVGTGTLYADDPSLTARDGSGELLIEAVRQPVPVVVGRRAIPNHAQILRHPALAARGFARPPQFDGSDLAAMLRELRALGLRRVFVEGGPSIASAMIAAGLADEVLVYVAPTLLGGPGVALGDLGVGSMAGKLDLRDAQVTRLGDDWLIAARVGAATGPAAAPGSAAPRIDEIDHPEGT